MEKKWGRPVYSLHGGIVAWSNAGGELHLPEPAEDDDVGPEASREGMTSRRKNKRTPKGRGDPQTTNLVHTYSGVWGRFLETDRGRKAFY